jgi:hypothetical protein
VAPGATLPADGWAEVTETGATFTASGAAFTYGRPRWITLAAINQTGRRSAPLTYGPVTLPDPTKPTSPGFCGDFAGGGFIAYMNAPATDPESGILGYQMRVVNAAGGILRDFPAGTAVDWPASQALAGNAIRLPLIPPVAGMHTVQLRAVNGFGVIGEFSQSGQMNTDLTPPPVAGVTSLVDRGKLAVNLTLANDPESGLAGVDIAFGTSPTDPTLNNRNAPSVLIPWATVGASVGNRKVAVDIPVGMVLPRFLYVYVRVRNGSGLLSASTSALVVQ